MLFILKLTTEIDWYPLYTWELKIIEYYLTQGIGLPFASLIFNRVLYGKNNFAEV